MVFEDVQPLDKDLPSLSLTPAVSQFVEVVVQVKSLQHSCVLPTAHLTQGHPHSTHNLREAEPKMY